MGKPISSSSNAEKGQQSQNASVLKSEKGLDKARRRVAKIEKKLRKLAAMTGDERDEMCERQVRRKLEKATAKCIRREEKLARLKEDIAAADTAMQAGEAKPLGESKESGWNNWAAAEFESEERKAKFLRFMGVKSSTATGGGASPFASAITKDGSSKIQKDLEKQFQAGVQMRLQAQRGGRGGLGM
ncbi:hypothetical protein GGI20_003109 [Coemansia sp. BCRC 34301]|nr:hypothetical protein GGI20_003109 [Coemansia sp. BCRC 34301]